jgi:hypothetical protein
MGLSKKKKYSTFGIPPLALTTEYSKEPIFQIIDFLQKMVYIKNEFINIFQKNSYCDSAKSGRLQ